MDLSLGTGQELRLEPVQRLEQDLELTVKLHPGLENPVEAAKRLYEDSRKVRVPVPLGDHVVIVRAAFISGEDFEMLFEDEGFGAIIGSQGDNYQFVNRDLRAPKCICTFLPTLIAFHCIAVLSVKSFGDDSGTIRQYQAIALEMAYARTMLRAEHYEAYEKWRQTVERTDFFQRSDWRDIVARTSERFSTMLSEMHANAAKAKFIVMGSGGDKFMPTPQGAVDDKGDRVICTRRINRKTVTISLPPGKAGR